MSEYTFKLPDLGEGTVEAEIAEWMVKVGDRVAEEDPICAMLTDKAAVELTAPVSGRVVAVAGVEGDMVTVGAPLIVFETDAAAPSAHAAAQTEMPAAAQTETPAATPATVAPASATRPGKVMTSPSIRARARAWPPTTLPPSVTARGSGVPPPLPRSWPWRVSSSATRSSARRSTSAA